MTTTVDVVIEGEDAAAIAATIDSVARGLRVLIVIRASRSTFARQLREAIATARVVLSPQQITILTGAEVACVDGVERIEAVVVRQLRTRRLIGFNASALLVFGERGRR
jgi:hypothetical protein